ncbi:sugar kinase [Streptomyces apocyni]|uniref:sugar kinase n=1 Tax=Streptomyces apocyni TaxID=2654677 RepID=UPI0022799F5F|nr:sugar kinase [Streptomyces apocyni]
MTAPPLEPLSPLSSPDLVEVVALGESMVAFHPAPVGEVGWPGRLADVESFVRGIGGAESNVACTLARAGHRVRWLSRVGADAFGDHLLAEIAACGVDTSRVSRDPTRPTGIYFRTPGAREPQAEPQAEPRAEHSAEPLSEVAYYRAGSAASAMSPTNMAPAGPADGHVLHLTGITAALSADCLNLLRTLTTHHHPGAGPHRRRPHLSFDVNYRPSLWSSGQPDPTVLLTLARASDLVFVGEDEAKAAWGITGGPEAIRAALPEPASLVVKQSAAGATLFTRDADGPIHEPAPRVDVVASVGAGDAFAAGYLSATLRGLPARQRLRHGHLTAAAALTVPGDLAVPPTRATADRLAALPPDRWRALHLTPGWTKAKAKAKAPR